MNIFIGEIERRSEKASACSSTILCDAKDEM